MNTTYAPFCCPPLTIPGFLLRCLMYRPDNHLTVGKWVSISQQAIATSLIKPSMDRRAPQREPKRPDRWVQPTQNTGEPTGSGALLSETSRGPSKRTLLCTSMMSNVKSWARACAADCTSGPPPRRSLARRGEQKLRPGFQPPAANTSSKRTDMRVPPDLFHLTWTRDVLNVAIITPKGRESGANAQSA